MAAATPVSDTELVTLAAFRSTLSAGSVLMNKGDPTLGIAPDDAWISRRIIRLNPGGGGLAAE